MLLVGDFDDVQQAIHNKGHSLFGDKANPFERSPTEVRFIANLLKDVTALQETKGSILLESQHLQGRVDEHVEIGIF
jgi:hypothetical protein